MAKPDMTIRIDEKLLQTRLVFCGKSGEINKCKFRDERDSNCQLKEIIIENGKCKFYEET